MNWHKFNEELPPKDATMTNIAPGTWQSLPILVTAEIVVAGRKPTRWVDMGIYDSRGFVWASDGVTCINSYQLIAWMPLPDPCEC